MASIVISATVSDILYDLVKGAGQCSTSDRIVYFSIASNTEQIRYLILECILTYLMEEETEKNGSTSDLKKLSDDEFSHGLALWIRSKIKKYASNQ